MNDRWVAAATLSACAVLGAFVVLGTSTSAQVLDVDAGAPTDADAGTALDGSAGPQADAGVPPQDALIPDGGVPSSGEGGTDAPEGDPNPNPNPNQIPTMPPGRATSSTDSPLGWGITFRTGLGGETGGSHERWLGELGGVLYLGLDDAGRDWRFQLGLGGALTYWNGEVGGAAPSEPAARTTDHFGITASVEANLVFRPDPHVVVDARFTPRLAVTVGREDLNSPAVWFRPGLFAGLGLGHSVRRPEAREDITVAGISIGYEVWVPTSSVDVRHQLVLEVALGHVTASGEPVQGLDDVADELAAAYLYDFLEPETGAPGCARTVTSVAGWDTVNETSCTDVIADVPARTCVAVLAVAQHGTDLNARSWVTAASWGEATARGVDEADDEWPVTVVCNREATPASFHLQLQVRPPSGREHEVTARVRLQRYVAALPGGPNGPRTFNPSAPTEPGCYLRHLPAPEDDVGMWVIPGPTTGRWDADVYSPYAMGLRAIDEALTVTDLAEATWRMPISIEPVGRLAIEPVDIGGPVVVCLRAHSD